MTTDPYKWYYVWSPKYEIFHQLLASSVSESAQFDLKPCFFPQSAFSTLYNPDAAHFFAGNSLKFDVIVAALKTNKGKHIIVSDADIIVQNPDKLAAYLKKYERFDVVYMQDNFINDTLNIGFSLIKSTDTTIAFFEKICNEIKTTGEQDQALVNKYIEESGLIYSTFMLPWVIQSNMSIEGAIDCYVMQMLCSNNKTYEENLFEKLESALFFFDLRDVKHLIVPSVYNKLIQFAKDKLNISPLANEEFIEEK